MVMVSNVLSHIQKYLTYTAFEVTIFMAAWSCGHIEASFQTLRKRIIWKASAYSTYYLPKRKQVLCIRVDQKEKSETKYVWVFYINMTEGCQ
jgi:hypothetical protein